MKMDTGAIMRAASLDASMAASLLGLRRSCLIAGARSGIRFQGCFFLSGGQLRLGLGEPCKRFGLLLLGLF